MTDNELLTTILSNQKAILEKLEEQATAQEVQGTLLEELTEMVGNLNLNDDDGFHLD